MPMPFDPWTSYPSLTLDRLTVVAATIRNTRNQAVLLHDEEAGDSFWSLGCRIYSRTMSSIKAAAVTHSWLSVLPETQNLRFTFSIGSLPIKFYKGDPDEIPARSLVRSFAELRQMKLALELEGIHATHILRLAVEADNLGNTTSITLVEVDETDQPTRFFEIPRDSVNVVEMKPKPISLSRPRLEVIEKPEEELKRVAAEDKSGTKS